MNVKIGQRYRAKDDAPHYDKLIKQFGAYEFVLVCKFGDNGWYTCEEYFGGKKQDGYATHSTDWIEKYCVLVNEELK